MRTTLFISLFLLTLIYSCAKPKESEGYEKEESESGYVAVKSDKDVSLDAGSYVSWFRSLEHGLKKAKMLNDLTYFLQYKSPDYIALIESHGEGVKEEVVEKRAKELQGLIYFDFRISLNGGQDELLKYQISSPAEYLERVKYMSFEMQKDIQLVQEKDTIPCGLYHFERIYDIGPYSNYLVAFDSKGIDLNKELTFVFNDKVFHNGLVKFTFLGGKLIYLPKLRIS
jgi:hypothetical protein